MLRFWTRCAVLLALLVAPASSSLGAGPRRIVSMNLCTDQIVLLLAGRDRISSISWLGADPAESPLANMAKGLPVNHGQAEEVIAAKPDLVLTGRYTTGFAKAMLRRLNYPVVEVDSPNTIADIAATFRVVAAAVEEQDRAEALLAEMDRRLRDIAQPAARQIAGSAIVYDANGFTVGRPGLADDVMTLLGLDNNAPDLGIGTYGQVPLESMLAVRPDHIIHLVYRPGQPSMASATVNHPALRGILRGRKPVEIMGHMFTCGTPLIADAAAQLRGALLGDHP